VLQYRTRKGILSDRNRNEKRRIRPCSL